MPVLPHLADRHIRFIELIHHGARELVGPEVAVVEHQDVTVRHDFDGVLMGEPREPIDVIIGPREIVSLCLLASEPPHDLATIAVDLEDSVEMAYGQQEVAICIFADAIRMGVVDRRSCEIDGIHGVKNICVIKR